MYCKQFDTEDHAGGLGDYSEIESEMVEFTSQREDLSCMIQVEELIHPIIREWMSGQEL